MENLKKLLLIIALAAAIVFTMGCKSVDDPSNPVGLPFINPNGNGGTLTVTDIPSEYNGKYALFNASLDDVIYIRGYQSVNESTETTIFSQILNGSVSIPLWLWKNNTAANSFDSGSSYTGNDTVARTQGNLDPCLFIWGGDRSSPLIDPFPLARIEFTVITFSNGSATISQIQEP
jgi:hypothetical protein